MASSSLCEKKTLCVYLRSFVDFAFGESGAFLYAPVCKEKKKGSFLKNWLAVENKMSAVILLLVAAFLGLAWYFTRDDSPKTNKPKPAKARSMPPSPKVASLLVFDLVTETDEACEHVVWFTRCEGDVYEISINGVVVSTGSGPESDVAHVKEFSSVAMMTAEKIAFPLTVGVSVYRAGELFGQGSRVVRGPGEPLPN